MLGGEHSVSAPIIKAHAEKYHDLSVLQIDAHADLRDTYDGTPHSHASIMARVVKDLRIPSVQVGIRSISAEEARLARITGCRPRYSGRAISSGRPIGSIRRSIP